MYALSKRDRDFCDMSKCMYLVLMNMWGRWGKKTRIWESYLGWEWFLRVEEGFWKLCEVARGEIRQIWIDFRLNEDKYELEVV